MQHEDTEPWDSVMAQLVGLGGGLLPLFAGLDGRYDWPGPDCGLTEEIIILVLILAGFALGSWALVERDVISPSC